MLRQQPLQAPAAISPAGGLAVHTAPLHGVVVMAQQPGLEGGVLVRRRQRRLAVVVDAGVKIAAGLQPGGEQPQRFRQRRQVEEGVGGDDVVMPVRPVLLQFAGDKADRSEPFALRLDRAVFHARLQIQRAQPAFGILASEIKEAAIPVQCRQRQRGRQPGVQQASESGAGSRPHVQAFDSRQAAQGVQKSRAHLAVEAALVQGELGLEKIGKGTCIAAHSGP